MVDSVLPLQGTQVQSLVGKVPYAMQNCHKEKKKNEILPCATTWVNLEGIILSGISQRKTNTVVITYMWNLNEYNKKTHRYREKTSHYQWEERLEERQYTGRGLRGNDKV